MGTNLCQHMTTPMCTCTRTFTLTCTRRYTYTGDVNNRKTQYGNTKITIKLMLLLGRHMCVEYF